MELLGSAQAGSTLFPGPADYMADSLLVKVEIPNHVTKSVENRGSSLHNVYRNVFILNLTLASQTLGLGLTLQIAVARVGQVLLQLGLWLGLLAFTARAAAHIWSHFTNFF